MSMLNTTLAPEHKAVEPHIRAMFSRFNAVGAEFGLSCTDVGNVGRGPFGFSIEWFDADIDDIKVNTHGATMPEDVEQVMNHHLNKHGATLY